MTVITSSLKTALPHAQPREADFPEASLHKECTLSKITSSRPKGSSTVISFLIETLHSIPQQISSATTSSANKKLAASLLKAITYIRPPVMS